MENIFSACYLCVGVWGVGLEAVDDVHKKGMKQTISLCHLHSLSDQTSLPKYKNFDSLLNSPMTQFSFTFARSFNI